MNETIYKSDFSYDNIVKIETTFLVSMIERWKSVLKKPSGNENYG
jgi:hypothetical protein